jgi:hypothetical protein
LRVFAGQHCGICASDVRPINIDVERRLFGRRLTSVAYVGQGGLHAAVIADICQRRARCDRPLRRVAAPRPALPVYRQGSRP